MENLNPNKVNTNLLIILYFITKLVPMVISCFITYLGYKLFILGVTGEASLSVNTTTVGGQLINAAPGLFFAVGGIVALIVSIWKGTKLNFGPNEINATMASIMHHRN